MNHTVHQSSGILHQVALLRGTNAVIWGEMSSLKNLEVICSSIERSLSGSSQTSTIAQEIRFKRCGIFILLHGAAGYSSMHHDCWLIPFRRFEVAAPCYTSSTHQHLVSTDLARDQDSYYPIDASRSDNLGKSRSHLSYISSKISLAM